MAEPDPGILQSVADGNLKTIAEAGSFAVANMMQAIALATQESVASMGRRGAMADAAMGASIKAMNEMDPQQAIALSKAIPADQAGILAQLGTTVAALQEIVKAAQTTPPQTGG